MARSVSITIPCRNEAGYIEKCLDSIVACDYDKTRLSVFVCDGQSEDGTDKIIKDYCSKFPFIYLIENKKRTTPFALNLGIKAKDADVKIILGAHSEIYSDYITQCVECLDRNPEAGCVGGIIENVFENDISASIGLAMSSVFGVGNAHFRTGAIDGFVDTVAFGAYRKEVFEKAGYFDEELIRNQDDEFNFRIHKAGFKIYLSKAIRSKYYVRASFAKLYRQYFQYGYWKVFVNRKHGIVTTVRQLFPPLFVIFLFSGLLASIIDHRFLLLYIPVLIFYLMMSFVFAARTSSSLKTIFQVMLSFYLLHISYGLGYHEGVFRFLILGKQPKSSATEMSR